MKSVVFFSFFAAILCACDPPPPPRAAEGEECSADIKCEELLACVDDAPDAPSVCKGPPEGCDPAEPEDFCDCDGLDTLCAEGNQGSLCINVGSRVSIECSFPE